MGKRERCKGMFAVDSYGRPRDVSLRNASREHERSFPVSHKNMPSGANRCRTKSQLRASASIDRTSFHADTVCLEWHNSDEMSAAITSQEEELSNA